MADVERKLRIRSLTIKDGDETVTLMKGDIVPSKLVRQIDESSLEPLPTEDADGDETTAAGSSTDLDAANARVAELESQLAEAKQAASLSYDSLSPEALAVEADKRGVTPEKGSGKDDNVIKADLVAALEASDRP